METAGVAWFEVGALAVAARGLVTWFQLIDWYFAVGAGLLATGATTRVVVTELAGATVATDSAETGEWTGAEFVAVATGSH